MAGPELSLQVGQAKQFEHGGSVRAVSHEPARRTVGGTPLHEAIHAGVGYKLGIHIHKASKIPGPEYNGITVPDRFDPIMAMGPKGHGCSGGDWDEALTKARGYDAGAAAATGSFMAAANWEGIQEVAREIDERGEIGNSIVAEAMERGRRRQAGIEAAIIQFVKPNGKVEERKTESVNGNVLVSGDMYPQQWVDLPKVA